uniref:Putative secreted protein n=1 Tax=Ixodes ricinus TaxID=34613 RepID=A0A147BV23_IXORI
MALVLGKHLVLWELAVQVFPDVVHPAGVSRVLVQLRKLSLVALHEEVSPRQILPGLGSHRRRNALAAPITHLLEALGHVPFPVFQHVSPLEFTLPLHLNWHTA